MNYIREHLGAKLFFSNLIVIAIGVIVLSITTNLTFPVAFNSHMGAMDKNMMSGSMGIATGKGQVNMMADPLFESFRASVFESLTYAALASVLAALIVSLLISRRIIAPVRTLSFASQRITDGHYDERVQSSGVDEIAQLGNVHAVMKAKLLQES